MIGVIRCPRCRVDLYLHRDSRWEPGCPDYPALSRVARIDICSACGRDEAIRDMQGLPPVPPDEWPVKERWATERRP